MSTSLGCVKNALQSAHFYDVGFDDQLMEAIKKGG